MPALQTKKYKFIRVPVDTPTPTPEIESPSPSPTPEYEAFPAPLNSPIPDSDIMEESESSGEETDDSPTPRARAPKYPPAQPVNDIVETKYRAGQTVEYRPIGGPDSNTGLSTGVIQRVLTTKTPAGDQKVAVNATPEVPQYEICNNNTGKSSALKGRNLMNIIAEPED